MSSEGIIDGMKAPAITSTTTRLTRSTELGPSTMRPESPPALQRGTAALATNYAETIVAPMTHPGNALDREVRTLMTPGVVSMAEDASLTQVLRALAAHRVHALLVMGQESDRPLGWVTATGLLAWLDADPAMACARDAITEPTIGIEPGSTGREALVALARPDVSHLLVQRTPGSLPEGVLSASDLIVGGSY